MPRLAAGKQRSRSGSLPARKRRPRLSPVGYLANPASLTGIPKLDSHHSGTRITFGDAKLTSLAQTLVEIDLANESDWIAAAKVPSALVDRAIRRFLREHGQELIAEHFELCLSLAESIVDTTYTESEPAPNGQLLLVLNTESSFPLGSWDSHRRTGTASTRSRRSVLQLPAPSPLSLGTGLRRLGRPQPDRTDDRVGRGRRRSRVLRNPQAGTGPARVPQGANRDRLPPILGFLPHTG